MFVEDRPSGGRKPPLENAGPRPAAAKVNRLEDSRTDISDMLGVGHATARGDWRGARMLSLGQCLNAG